MTSNDLEQRRRVEQAYRRLGTRTPQCQCCAETDPLVLTGIYPDILCYEHARIEKGTSPIEHHHPSGRQNDPFTIPIPGNDHRWLNDRQREWPLETLRNPRGDPLLKAAAALRSFLDVLRLLIERVLGWVPPFLEQMSAYLREKLGDRWWDQFQWSEGNG
jgi:hypothetical protein